MDLLSLPFQIQSSMVTEECRLAIFLSPGNLLSYYHYDHPLLPNKLLLLDEVIDYSQAEEYLKDGFALNERYLMDANLHNLLVVILPNLNQVISFFFLFFLGFAFILTFVLSVSFSNTIDSKWVGSLPRLFIY